ncbi:hypothetical protein [Hymenobacter terrenus]|uniref:hypothetical protein n=1 Tax=Hymenobacter terrenus TaxID=1629124 RepID=UPI0006196288|nr:hypothetical protein [Hymenobacter terrenus]
MKRIISYEEWITDNVDTGDYEEVYALYDSVENLSSEGGFEIQPGRKNDGEQHLLTSMAQESMLIIASDKARTALLNHIRVKYMDDMDADSYHLFHRRLEEDN